MILSKTSNNNWTPTAGGSMGLAGDFNIRNQFWTPARMYLKEESVNTGSWPSNYFPVDTIIVGTCFGFY